MEATELFINCNKQSNLDTITLYMITASTINRQRAMKKIFT